MNDDRAGSMPEVNVSLCGKEYTDADKRMVQGAIFYLQEVAKLFPFNAHMALVVSWEHDGDQRETINLGTLSNTQVIALLVDVERRRNPNFGVQGNG